MFKIFYQTIEDYYVYYVHILGISEAIFWESELDSLFSIVENKLAYDSFMSYVKNKEMERATKKR